MATITKRVIQELVRENDLERLYRLFEEDPSQVRRYLVRLAFNPDDPLHEPLLDAITFLCERTSVELDEFWRETIRRQLWSMNEEGANIPWSAPELIGAVIAGDPVRFGMYFSFNFEAAKEEPTFQPSLVRAFDHVAAVSPELVAPYAASIDALRLSFGHGNEIGNEL